MIVSPVILKKVLDAALSTGGDFADIFVEDSWSSQLSLLDGKPQKAIVGELFGAGVRLFFGHEIVYVTTNELSEAGLLKAAFQAARSRPSAGSARSSMELKTHGFDSIHVFGEKPWEIGRDKK